MTELPKHYDPKEAQTRFAAFWAERGIGHSVPDDREPFSIVIPPPNVTGALHMGHALNGTLQDVLVRWRRMQGYNAEWIPGTDHAGIATQAVVEKRVMAEEKKTRRDLGRDELVRRIWLWKDQYEKRILGQLKSLGCSADWERTRFTLDPMCAKAVRQTFFDMFRDGYIFRGKRLVNWDTQLQTSVADDETYDETVAGGFWTFEYRVVGEADRSIRFSTTRPETMLGDVAVAVHPSDPRYLDLIGKKVLVPLTGREIPIVADALLVDPELGTGCVKVTPAHDHNDYACGLRHNLPMVNILNPDGTINAEGGERFAGMDRYKAREAVTTAMDELGLFAGKEDRQIPMKFSDRSKTPIEPLLSDQWFVKMGDIEGKAGLAQMAIDAVTDGRVKFFPERYAKTYLDWLGEKRDWCISRQLWWGHRIAVWYTDAAEAELQKAFGGRVDVSWRPDETAGGYLVSSTTDLPETIAEGRYALRQDADVLDTWFSSALWPHSTFGWPDATPELKYYYPTSVLVTSRDIITLWVARMVIAGLYNLGKVPFKDVYITPKILDGFGETMSKTRGNGVDPLDIIEIYGADALRFVMVSAAGETQDSRLPVANSCPGCGTLMPLKQEHMYMRTKKLACPKCATAFRPGGPWLAADPELPTAKQGSERFEVGRNFANKLWNATRFLLMNLEGYTPGELKLDELPIEDRWILSRLATATADVTGHLEGYRFSDVSRVIYEFAWSEFCDWYIEMSKHRLKDPASRPSVQRVLVGVLDGILRLVSPVMPFLAESLWQALNGAAPMRGLPIPVASGEAVVLAPWPTYPKAMIETSTEARIARMQDAIGGIREVRNRYMLDIKHSLTVSIRCDESIAEDLRQLSGFIGSLAGVGTLSIGPTQTGPKQSGTALYSFGEVRVSLEGLIDPAAEIKRLQKQQLDKTKQLEGIRKKLGNADFVARAPQEVVIQQNEQASELEKQLALIAEGIADLS